MAKNASPFCRCRRSFTPQTSLAEESSRQLAVRGQKNEAVEEYKRILQIDPERTEAMQEIGRIYRSVGDFNRALEHYEMYAKRNPENADSYKGVAEVYSDLGEYDATEIVEGGRVSEAFAILDSVRKEVHPPYN